MFKRKPLLLPPSPGPTAPPDLFLLGLVGVGHECACQFLIIEGLHLSSLFPISEQIDSYKDDKDCPAILIIYYSIQLIWFLDQNQQTQNKQQLDKHTVQPIGKQKQLV